MNPTEARELVDTLWKIVGFGITWLFPIYIFFRIRHAKELMAIGKYPTFFPYPEELIKEAVHYRNEVHYRDIQRMIFGYPLLLGIIKLAEHLTPEVIVGYLKPLYTWLGI